MMWNPRESWASRSGGASASAPGGAVTGAPVSSRRPMAFSLDNRSTWSQVSRFIRIRRSTSALPSRSQAGWSPPHHRSASSSPWTSGCTVPSTWPNRLRIGSPGPSCGSRKPRCTQRNVVSGASPVSRRRWACATVVGEFAQTCRSRSVPDQRSSSRSTVKGGSGASHAGAGAPTPATTRGPMPTVSVRAAGTPASSGSWSVSGPRPAMSRSMSSVRTVSRRRTTVASTAPARSRATKAA